MSTCEVVHQCFMCNVCQSAFWPTESVFRPPVLGPEKSGQEPTWSISFSPGGWSVKDRLREHVACTRLQPCRAQLSCDKGACSYRKKVPAPLPVALAIVFRKSGWLYPDHTSLPQVQGKRLVVLHHHPKRLRIYKEKLSASV